jgi:3',5'-cyclic AMP phosphodiesterase CpdA
MRIVHFSDIHVAAWPRDPSVLGDKRVLGLLNYLLRRRHQVHPEYLQRAIGRIRALGPDWVVLTGDLTCVGTGAEFARALDLLSPLCNGPAPYQFLFVPGNHDAYVRRPGCATALHAAFDRLNRGRWRLEDLPLRVDLPGLRLFAVDECRPMPWWQSAGEVPAAARTRLQEWLEEPRLPGEKRVLVGHFPARLADGSRLPRRRRLRGDEWLQGILDRGLVDVHLCGHHHPPFLRREPGGALEICAGALTLYGKLNVLDYSAQNGRFTQFWEDLSGEGLRPLPVADPALLAAGARG